MSDLEVIPGMMRQEMSQDPGKWGVVAGSQDAPISALKTGGLRKTLLAKA